MQIKICKCYHTTIVNDKNTPQLSGPLQGFAALVEKQT